jgi:phosphate-selective porin OprO/OprP
VSFTNNNGLKFKTGDGNFEGAIGGRIYFVYRHVFERRDTGTTNANSFLIDTARFQLDGTFFKEFYYRLEGEAGKNDDFRIKDTYIGWRGIENHSLQFGAFKEPFGMEHTTSSRFNDFTERSLVDRLVPAHDIGMMWSSSFAEKVVGAELGFFNGNGRQAAAQAENNDEKDICARLRITPFRAGENEWLKQLRLGVAMTYGDVDNLALGDVTGADFSNLTMIDFTGTEDGVRTRMGLEFSWLMGPMSVRAEYVTMNREVVTGPADREDFDTDAYYLQFTYLLTGETKTLENRIVPKKNFSVKDGNWGAWELALRLASLDASDGEDVGVVGAGANQEIQEITVGVNWWMTPNVRLMFNYEMFNMDEEVANGGDPIDDQTIFYTRFQIDF